MSDMKKPEDPKDPLLLDHEADGIRELDNNLPRWWVWLFYICILQAVGYMLYYHVFNAGPLQAAEYQIETEAGEKVKLAAQAKFESSLATLQPSTDPDILGRGEQSYELNCAPCHRSDGGGLVGPNLCDDFWIHGSSFADNLNIIINGFPVKGMLAWKESMQPAEIYAVASYIQKFRGTSPPNPKPPENTDQPEQPNEFE